MHVGRHLFVRSKSVLYTRLVSLAAFSTASKSSQPGMASVDEKQAVRRTVKAALRKLEADEMKQQSRAITDQILQLQIFKDALRLGIYVHCAKLREVDTSPLLSEGLLSGRRVYVPLVQDNNANMQLLHLEDLKGLTEVLPFNILEPNPHYEDGSPRENAQDMDAPLELLLMPGLAFDRRGNRLGRGGGYYDKFIAGSRARAAQRAWQPPLLVALAFREQMVEEVPVTPSDCTVDIIVTSDAILACTERGKDAAAR